MKKRYPLLLKNCLLTGLYTAFSATLSLNLQAQTGPAKLWDKTIGGSGNDILISLQQTSDGGYIMGGYSDSPSSGDKTQASKGNYDFWLVKLDAGNNKVWDKTFGGNNKDELYFLQQTTDGGYILAGTSNSGISGDKSQASQGLDDFWIVKLDGSGNKIWDKTLGGNSSEELSSLQQTNDGGYILGGTSTSGISGDKSQAWLGGYDYWVIKLDASGNKIWDKTIGGSGIDKLKSLQQTSDGGYFLGGYSDSGIGGDKSQASKGSYDYWMVKLDAIGNKTWDKSFGGNSNDYFTCLQQTADGGYVLGGYSESGISGDKSQSSQFDGDYWIVKLDGSGNKTWDRTFGGSCYDFLWSVKQTSEGGYILGGASCSGISSDKTEDFRGQDDYWVIKLDASGNKTWDKTLGGIDADALRSLQQTSDGGYILGGYSNSPVSTEKTQAPKGSIDFWLIKLPAFVTGMKEPEAGFPVLIYPNPSQGKFSLKLGNVQEPTVALSVSDLLGRVIFQQDLSASNHHISQELALPTAKGIYLLQLKAGEQTIVRKIVVE